MNKLAVLVFLLLLAGTAQTQQPQCIQSEFSGSAAQGQEFKQEFGQGITFTVFPMRLKEDPRWGWFQIDVLGDREHAVFVFNPSDTNWLLATDFASAFIGGPNSDVKVGIEYRVRYFVFPLSLDDKQKLRETARLVNEASTEDEKRTAVTALKSMHLAQLKFEITDYTLAHVDPPTSVDWAKFTGVVTFPSGFRISEGLRSTDLECPAIPDEVSD